MEPSTEQKQSRWTWLIPPWPPGGTGRAVFRLAGLPRLYRRGVRRARQRKPRGGGAVGQGVWPLGLCRHPRTDVHADGARLSAVAAYHGRRGAGLRAGRGRLSGLGRPATGGLPGLRHRAQLRPGSGRPPDRGQGRAEDGTLRAVGHRGRPHLAGAPRRMP